MFWRNWAFLYLNPTKSESAFEACIAKLGKPYRAQYPFPGLHRVVDFAFLSDKVVIEVDGASHNTPVQRRKDLVSSIALEKRGWAVIRFTNEEVINPRFVLTADNLAERIRGRLRLPELEAALATLLREHPELSELPAKKRKRSTKLAPKKARKRRAAQDKTERGTKQDNAAQV